MLKFLPLSFLSSGKVVLPMPSCPLLLTEETSAKRLDCSRNYEPWPLILMMSSTFSVLACWIHELRHASFILVLAVRRSQERIRGAALRKMTHSYYFAKNSGKTKAAAFPFQHDALGLATMTLHVQVQCIGIDCPVNYDTWLNWWFLSWRSSTLTLTIGW